MPNRSAGVVEHNQKASKSEQNRTQWCVYLQFKKRPFSLFPIHTHIQLARLQVSTSRDSRAAASRNAAASVQNMCAINATINGLIFIFNGFIQ